MSNAIDDLIAAFAKLPGLGPRSAQRIVLKLIRQPDRLLAPLHRASERVLSDVVTCEQCGNLDTQSPCQICSNPRRSPHTLCVVEDVADLWALERGGMFKGQYHVLGGTLSALDGRGPEALGIPKLLRRVAENQTAEVILATNNTLEGQTTAHMLQEELRPLPCKTTRLAQGIPIGGELDYIDEGTLSAALMARAEW